MQNYHLALYQTHSCSVHNINEINKSTGKQIKEDIYVDNVIAGKNNDNKVLQWYKEVKEIFHDVSMNLHDWLSNLEIVNENTSPEDQMKERVTKVSGLILNTNSDELLYQQRNLETWNKQKQSEKFWPRSVQFFILLA